MNPAFKLDHVTKRYREQLALDDVSIEVGRGHVIALLGENGAGKTTTLRILLGLIQPDYGTSEVLGLDSQLEGQEIRRRVGYVAERPTLYEWMTVAEIGWFAAGFYPLGYINRYRELIQGFELPEERKIKQLSKGMRAKVALALGLAHQPELLILDEPTSGLDPMVRREFLESMVDVAAEGRTVLLSSHQIGEVERVADMVAILRKGKIVAYEPLDELKRNVQELTVTLKNGTPHALPVPGTILSRTFRDRQWRLLVQNLAADGVEEVNSHETVHQVKVRHPSLEEIFLAFMQNENR